MRHALDEVGPPPGEVFRVGWYSDPLGPSPWTRVMADGTFGNRFDDPESEFRCIYVASTADAAFAETMSRFRISPDNLARIKAMVSDAEELAEIFGEAIDFTDPRVPRGIVTAEWRAQRSLARTTLDPSLRFVNFTHRTTLEYLEYEMAEQAAACGVVEMDFVTLFSKDCRPFTQACARHFYNLCDGNGVPSFAGIRYMSRHDVNFWECWALFDDRIKGRHLPAFPESIMPDDEALLRVAQSFRLSIEVFPGTSLLRP